MRKYLHFATRTFRNGQIKQNVVCVHMYVYISMFVCPELIEETGGFRKMILVHMGYFWASPTS